MPEMLTSETKTAPGKILLTADEWTNEVTKTGYIGMTAHWIDVRDGKWELRGEAVGLRAILGDHGGDNLGRYVIGLCDHVRICSKQDSKVRSPVMPKKDLLTQSFGSFTRSPLITQLVTIQNVRWWKQFTGYVSTTECGMRQRISSRAFLYLRAAGLN